MLSPFFDFLFILLQHPIEHESILTSNYQSLNCSNLQGLTKKKPSIRKAYLIL